MSISHAKFVIPLALLGSLPALPAAALLPAVYSFSTGDPDGRMATATRPDAGGLFEIESADDFVLTHSTSITSATFTGLLPAGAAVGDVVVEIYRVFPKDSTVPPSGSVPTRVNSPSDVAFGERDSTSGSLNFVTGVLNASFPASNSVQPDGIRLHSGGNGAVDGAETKFTIAFTDPFLLPADHYFFVPQVQLDDGSFLWLSASRPIGDSGTPFPPGFTDLQSWTRDEGLDPDWLRVGSDIVGGDLAPTFNAAFSLNGVLVPEPSTWAMLLLGFAGLGFAGYRSARKARPGSA
jgi:hypothetical protein